MACHFVVIVVVELVNQATAHFVKLLYHAVYVVVQCREAYCAVVVVRCAQVHCNAHYVLVAECLNLWLIVAEGVDVAYHKEQVGRNIVLCTHFGNCGLTESESYIQTLQDGEQAYVACHKVGHFHARVVYCTVLFHYGFSLWLIYNSPPMV